VCCPVEVFESGVTVLVAEPDIVEDAEVALKVLIVSDEDVEVGKGTVEVTN